MHPVALLASVGEYLGSGHLRKRLALALVLASMVVVGGCGGCGLAATTTGGGGGTADTATATATTAAATASTTTTAATATTHTTGPTPTRTSPPPTATPLPALKGKLVTQGLGSIGPNTNSSIVDVSCPAGYLVAGGGVSSGYTTFNLMWNAPINTTTWRSEIYNTSSSPIFAQVQVMCLAVSGLVGQVVTRGMGTINSGTNSTIVDVSCPSGYLVAGGGINAGYGTLVSMWNAPISTTTWREEVYNTGGTAAAQVQVECLRVSGLVGKVLTTDLGNVSAGANSPIIDTACPSGYLIAGGGLKSGDISQTLMQSLPINVTTWRSEVFNTGSATIAAQAQVDCLKR